MDTLLPVCTYLIIYLSSMVAGSLPAINTTHKWRFAIRFKFYTLKQVWLYSLGQDSPLPNPWIWTVLKQGHQALGGGCVLLPLPRLVAGIIGTEVEAGSRMLCWVQSWGCPDQSWKTDPAQTRQDHTWALILYTWKYWQIQKLILLEQYFLSSFISVSQVKRNISLILKKIKLEKSKFFKWQHFFSPSKKLLRTTKVDFGKCY